MNMQTYIDEVKLKLTSGILECELDDSTIAKLVNSALREIQRYIDLTKLATIPFAKCIDLSNCGVNSIVRVYRAESYYNTGGGNSGLQWVDPMYAQQWQLMSNGNIYNLSDWIYNFASWNTMLQIRGTMSTDLAYVYDSFTHKLYINVSAGLPQYITIEYVPRINNVEEIVSDYWIDILMRMSVALGKIALGRVRSRFTQSNALWQQDGETMLNEGNAELNELRQKLEANTQLCYGVD